MLQAHQIEPEGTPWPAVSAVQTPQNVPIDPNGNLTTKTENGSTWTYTWDAENRLKKVERDAVEVARFAYDPVGRRVEKIAGGVTSAWTHDGEDIVEERPTPGAAVRYVHGPQPDEWFARQYVDGGTTLYYHADSLGSIVATTDAAGNITSRLGYDAWGNLDVGEAGACPTYAGRQWDAEIKLYFYRARYYDPVMGRFIAEEPEGEGGNLLSYVDNSPVNYVDPLGRYKTKHFPADKKKALEDAIEIVRNKLSEDPCCAGKDGPRILKALDKAKYIYKEQIGKGKYCGQAVYMPRPFPAFLLRRIKIAAMAFDPGRCEELECTVLHEATHLGFRSGDEKRTWGLEFKCFGCGTGSPPPPPK